LSQGRHPRDRGFAMIAVLVAVVALAGLAYDVVLQGRTNIVTAQAEVDRARMEAAADAGLAMAEAGLVGGGPRWPIDGTPRTPTFDGIQLTVAIEDERGKIPVNVLSDTEARRLFEAAGASGQQLATLTDSFLDWRDDDEERRPNGAESADYTRRGYRARDGDITAIGELARINGMTPAIYARIVPYVTLFFGETGGFNERTASPFAIRVMTGEDDQGPASIERAREIRGQRTRLGFDDKADAVLTGRRFTVRVTAHDAGGGRLTRATIVEPTGDPRAPIWVRAAE